MVILEEYCDRAISGKTDSRPEFQRMIKDSDKHQFTAVIMYTLDRFARNRYDSAMYKAKLKKNGVKLFYTEQSISQEPEGIILESVLEGMAEYYSENLSRGVKRGMRENALKQMTNGGVKPLGYKRGADGRYEIDTKTAPIVKKIFELCSEGLSQKKIADQLNSEGYRTKKGAKFRVSSISSVLGNEKYKGTFRFKEIVKENGIPAIITEEEWENAQRILQKHTRHPAAAKAKVSYLLTTKAFCGVCGSNLVGESGKSHTGTVYHYYKCSRRKRGEKCSKKADKKDVLEQFVVQTTVNEILTPEMIEKISTVASEMANKEFYDRSNLIALEKNYKAVNKQIENILDLVQEGITVPNVKDRLLELNSQLEDIDLQITKEKNKQSVLITKEQVQFWLLSFLKGDIKSQSYCERIIDTLVNRVEVSDIKGGREIRIVYNTTQSKGSNMKLMADIKLQNSNLFVNSDYFVLIKRLSFR